MKREEGTTKLIIREAMEEGSGELSSKNPMVLSCGGVYIPQNRRRRFDQPLWKILNIADCDNPTKVVASGLPKSPLTRLLEKENLN